MKHRVLKRRLLLAYLAPLTMFSLFAGLGVFGEVVLSIIAANYLRHMQPWGLLLLFCIGILHIAAAIGVMTRRYRTAAYAIAIPSTIWTISMFSISYFPINLLATTFALAAVPVLIWVHRQDEEFRQAI